MEWTIPAFAFLAEACTHIPTPEGWEAELALAMCSRDASIEIFLNWFFGSLDLWHNFYSVHKIPTRGVHDMGIPMEIPWEWEA